MFSVLQAALKDAHLENRLVLAVKPVKALTGAPHMLSSLIAAEAGDAPEHADTTMQAQAVPGLALEKVSAPRS
jgi:hypothetical protein